MKTAIQMIADGLRAMGADGLCTDGCGCGLGDLAPCHEWCGDCVPAKKVVAREAGEYWEAGDVIYRPIDQPGDG